MVSLGTVFFSGCFYLVLGLNEYFVCFSSYLVSGIYSVGLVYLIYLLGFGCYFTYLAYVGYLTSYISFSFDYLNSFYLIL